MTENQSLVLPNTWLTLFRQRNCFKGQGKWISLNVSFLSPKLCSAFPKQNALELLYMKHFQTRLYEWYIYRNSVRRFSGKTDFELTINNIPIIYMFQLVKWDQLSFAAALGPAAEELLAAGLEGYVDQTARVEELFGKIWPPPNV